jgi:hypothetical protein
MPTKGEKQTKIYRGKRYHLVGRYETKIQAEKEGQKILKNQHSPELYKIRVHVSREVSHPHHYGKEHFALWVHFPPERAKYFGHLTVHSGSHRASGRKR